MAAISEEEVRSAVRRYWEVYTSRKPGGLAELYTFDALIFSAFSARPELARVGCARRDREYSANAETKVQYKLTSPIEVRILADNVALAIYTFHWVATNIREPILGKTVSRTIADGRQTHVFVSNADGQLVMVHQHASDVCRAPAEATP